MIRLSYFAFLFFFLIIASTETPALKRTEVAKHLEAMNWLSEEYPPYNYRENEQVVGISVDILMAAFKILDVNITPKDIRILPWNRSYVYIQRNPETALFSMTYTDERERLMKFVGPIISTTISIFSSQQDKFLSITPENLSQHRIGVVRNDIGDLLIRQFGVNPKAIIQKNSLKQLIYLLRTKKLDAVVYESFVFKYTVANSVENENLYKEVYVLKVDNLGYAFHNSTDPEVLAALQKAIDKLRADGTIKNIIAKYRNR